MTTTPPPAGGGSPDGPPGGLPDAPHDDGPRVSRDQLGDLARLRRTTGRERHVAGVAGGLARHLDIDPAIVRVVLVVLAFFGGAGILLYVALWLLVPEDGAETAVVPLDDGARSAGVIAVGVLAALMLLGDTWGPWGGGWFPWPLAVVAVVVAYVLSKRGSGNAAPGATGAGPPPYAPGTSVSFTKDGPQVHQAAPQSAAPYGQMMYAPVAPVPPRPPRRGPILFGWTLALLALGLGLLALVDVAGASVPDSAYPALALGVIAVMLLLGAWFGRAGGLIVLGLVAALALAGTTAAEEYVGTDVTAAPTTAAAVDDRYHVSAGELYLDLSEVVDPEALAGRTIEVDGDVGRLEVTVPEGVDVRVETAVDGLGSISILGESVEGIDLVEQAFLQASDSDAASPGQLTIDATLAIGVIEIQQS